jgi:hypothetical protein
MLPVTGGQQNDIYRYVSEQIDSLLQPLGMVDVVELRLFLSAGKRRLGLYRPDYLR